MTVYEHELEQKLSACQEELADQRVTLDYIATMLEGDTDRVQVAQYIRDDLLSSEATKGDTE